jgi:hypothetical protein
MSKITIVRGIEPDTENGGKRVGDVIVGAKKICNRWMIEGSDTLYDTRQDAETELTNQEFYEAIFHALKLNPTLRYSSQDIQHICMNNISALHAAVTTIKFASLRGVKFGRKITKEVLQETTPVNPNDSQVKSFRTLAAVNEATKIIAKKC